MDIKWMSFWDIAITIRYPGLSYPTDIQETSVHMYEILQTKWKYFKIPYRSEKYVIVPLLHNKNELF